MSPESKKTTREKAAAARQAAEAEQRKRDRRIRLIGGLGILVLIGIIFGAVFYSNAQNQPTEAPTSIVADAKVPTGVYTTGDLAWGLPVNKPDSAKPTLAIWEDFGCPACKQLESVMGKDILGLANDGTVNLVWRPTTFIEKNFPRSPNPDSSTRAASALGCAVEAGKGTEFHTIVFEHTPTGADEGNGWTNDELIQYGKDAGISGAALDTFSTCVTDKTYTDWANNSYLTFVKDGIGGTPYMTLNGTKIPEANYQTFDALKKYIAENS